MPNLVIHFGVDASRRLIVLEKSGYDINSCGMSISTLENVLRAQSSIDAVVLSEIPPRPAKQAVELVKSFTFAPIVLFAEDGVTYEESDFDLIVPPLTLPSRWLRELEELTARSRLLRKKTESLRQEPTQLRKRATFGG